MSQENIAIRAEGISKCYRIGLKDQTHDTFGGALVGFLRRPLANYKKYRSLYDFHDINLDSDSNGGSWPSDIIWALRNISFEVREGEVLGIIGRNGAGKSTLLKILSRITYPTSGYVEIHGRNSSLLEVGTGFHNELTGRENVYLNGTILGMNKREIDQRFDDIVDFSGVQKFLDTPVKRYSSGMRVRLAFAIAAHLRPEVLIVDEVLAVGDAEFQAKCIGKMGSVAKEGRTVLFVSHNMGAIIELCSRVLWVEEGRLRLDGLPHDVVTKYLSSGGRGVDRWSCSPSADNSARFAQLKHARLLSANENVPSTVFQFDDTIKIDIEYELNTTIRAFRAYVFLRDLLGNIVWASHDTDSSEIIGQPREAGIYHSTCVFPGGLLRPGHYLVSIGIYGQPREAVEEEHVDAMSFDVSAAGYPFNRDQRKGVITPHLSWNVVRQPPRGKLA